MSKQNKAKKQKGGLNLHKQIRSQMKQINALINGDKYLTEGLLNAFSAELANLKTKRELFEFYEGVKEALGSAKGKGRIVAFFKVIK